MSEGERGGGGTKGVRETGLFINMPPLCPASPRSVQRPERNARAHLSLSTLQSPVPCASLLPRACKEPMSDRATHTAAAVPEGRVPRAVSAPTPRSNHADKKTDNLRASEHTSSLPRCRNRREGALHSWSCATLLGDQTRVARVCCRVHALSPSRWQLRRREIKCEESARSVSRGPGTRWKAFDPAPLARE